MFWSKSIKTVNLTPYTVITRQLVTVAFATAVGGRLPNRELHWQLVNFRKRNIPKLFPEKLVSTERSVEMDSFQTNYNYLKDNLFPHTSDLSLSFALVFFRAYPYIEDV